MNFKKALFFATVFICGNLIPTLVTGTVYNTFVNDKGYEVMILHEGYSAVYNGCSPKKRNRKRDCIRLEVPEKANGNYYKWNNKGYRYEMNPLNRNATKYRLKVYTSKGKVILNQVLWSKMESNVTLLNYSLAGENWENSFVKYDIVKSQNAPGGFVIFNAPNKASRIRKETHTPTKLSVKGHVINNEGFFFMSKWSWEQHLKGKKPNWVWIKRLAPSKAKRLIQNRAKQVVLALKNKNSTLAKFAHPTLGIRFSPYSYVTGNDVKLAASQLRYIFSNSTKYLWGHYDGSGDPIKLTFTKYYQEFIYDKDFSNAEKIGYNKSIGHGNSINNSFTFYPSAIIVEFHFTGFDPKFEGMDWKSLRLVFEEKDNIWYIVGIIHDQWTI